MGEQGYPVELQEFVHTGIKMLDQALAHVIAGSDSSSFRSVTNSGWFWELPGAPFSLSAYNWSNECECTTESWSMHEEGCKTLEPNFEYKYAEGGFKVQWYKHIGRSAYQSRQLSFGEWVIIFEDCWEWVIRLSKNEATLDPYKKNNYL